VSFDGTRIAYSDEGKGPAVILLHGFGTDCAMTPAVCAWEVG
jgi:hypothetical protein